MAPRDYRNREHCLDVARDGFIKAGAALTEPHTAENLAFAFLCGAIALIRIAEADETEAALAIVSRGIQAAKAEGRDG